ncbi:LamG-like jellyroll fold domain-containing protein [Pedobacter nyackensis]|uniref:LamG-like jellyroll fold domain-containing protein n=1 Tax=Pedobacter nyackensis TaxID=475255 RepID=UPI00292E205F|nr:LamG-like jellyroll fold domain-containing protein [Pedobacter nyackensis]
MKELSFFCAKQFAALFFVIVLSQSAFAQTWMKGYNFRKTITVDKSKVSGASNLLNFNLLIELQSVELSDLPGCNRAQHNALPISFALKSKPDVPIGFQIDSYDPVTGRLICWVQIAELITAGRPGFNEIYFYYGGNEAEGYSSEETSAIWTMGYQRVWHMGFDAEPAVSFNAVPGLGSNAIGVFGMNAASFTNGIIGAATSFNGVSDAMHSTPDTNRNFCISGWIKLRQLGTEQMIFANDSAGNGCLLKINAQGKIVFDVIILGTVSSHVTVEALPVDTWVFLTASLNGRLKRILLNGLYKGGGFAPVPGRHNEGSIIIGRSKQNDRYFNGVIDELRVGNVERSIDWILTEYKNQLNPVSFVTISTQEINPEQHSDVNRFTGANGTSSWNDEANWSFGRVPGSYTNVVVTQGREVQIDPGNSISVNSLGLETGARLVLAADLNVNCKAQFDISSSVILKERVRLTFKNDVINNGEISLDQHLGTLVFNGGASLQSFSGSGTTTVSHLEVNQAIPLSTILLNAKINVSTQLSLLKGILNANDQLTLLANRYKSYGTIAPVGNIYQTGIVGNVNVQQFIDGSFSNPSTARGWRLLSSPVFQSPGSIREYNFNAVQQSIFVTGPGGIVNGFDVSPNNNPTIYTHNQALPGTLSQKYTGIANMSASVTLGKGFYVFSRGSRSDPNAFEQQIQRPPFSNPQAYTITAKGKLFVGELKIDLFNRNAGKEGDGYNLLGNPYASPITWGKVQKVNILPFVWVFDPKNNAYLVTDDQAHVIHSGEGFFVKVSTGHSTGEVTFTEASKYSAAPVLTSAKFASVDTKKGVNTDHIQTELRISLSKEDLSDEYVLIMKSGGHDEITDADAPKIGEGYVSISGLTSNDSKLAIDERGVNTASRTIQLFVKDWDSGTYELSLIGKIKNKEQVILVDHYLNKQITVKEGKQQYLFDIDAENSDTHGRKRFSLLIQPFETMNPGYEEQDNSLLLYPNPISDMIYIKSGSQSWRNLKILIRTITGQVVWTGDLPLLEPGMPVQLPANHFMKGLYILQLIDTKRNRTIATFKMLKN